MADDDHVMDYSQITENIFLGSDLCKGNVCPIHRNEFKKLGIRVEINMSMEKKEFPPEDIDVYSWIPVEDMKAPNESQLDIGTSIINEAVRSGSKIYIHCKNGHGRSPTMTIAYLMRYEKKSYEEAFLVVQKGRPEIHIQQVQVEALNKFGEKYQ